MLRFGSLFRTRRRKDRKIRKLARQVEALEERSLLTATELAALVEFGPLAIDLNSYGSSKILLQLKSGATADDLTLVSGTTLIASGASDSGFYEVELDGGITVDTALAAYKESEAVLFAEPDYRIELTNTFVPNDSMFGSLWGLDNTGQSGGTIDADIDAPEAWSVTTGSSSVIVAVIDTGIDYNHIDLADNIWVNQGEIAGNGIDDDQNGYVDDVHGFDFANFDSDPMDDHGHGTHVAGTIGAVGDNGIGVAGVSQNVQLMALKFLDASGSGFTSAAISALNYAVANGASISNNSWGGGGYSTALFNAIAAARNAGHIFVAAAGNDGVNNDASPHYPSSYSLDNVVSVASTDRNDQLSGFSNYGVSSVDLGAPGSSILSTTPGNTYSYYSGTSMATPHVSGVIALVQSQHPDWTYDQIIQQLLVTVDPIQSLQGKTVTGGRLNAAAAVAAPAEDVTGPQIVAVNPPDSVAGPISSIRVRFNEPIDVASFTPSDVTLFSGPSGPIAVNSVNVVAGSGYREFDLTFDPQVELGDYSMTLGPNIADIAGNLMDQDADGNLGEAAQDQFEATFTIADRSLYSSGQVSAPISDGQVTRSFLSVGDNVRIADINVLVDLTHTWVGDLRLALVSPQGTVVDLVLFRGGSGDNFENTVFDDEANLAIDAGGAPFTGYYRPEGSLATYDGLSGQGIWELRVEDWYSGDTGVLNSWALDIELAEPNVAPVFDDAGFHVNENSPNGTLVGTAAASDANTYETLSYSIVSDNSGGAFSVNPVTGAITVNDASVVDFETVSTFELVLRATDVGGLSDTATMTIHVDDVNEAPVVQNQSFSVNENSPSGTAVGTVIAADPDAGDSLNWVITSGNSGGAFQVDAASGVITVNNSGSLDYESTTSFSLTVAASDSGGLSNSATVLVAVNDVNDAPTVQDRTFQINEHSQNGTVLGTVIASDVDAGDSLVYAIANGNDGGTFSIDPVTGRITLVDNTLLDFETHPVFQLTVDATDTGGLSASGLVTVNLLDVNEPPVLGSISNQTLLHNLDTLTLSLPGTDVDGDSLVYSAEFVADDPVAALAYQLDQQYGLFDYTGGHYWFNYFGQQEKWLEGSGGVYYVLMPNGGLHRWAGSFGASPLLGTLDSTYHADPTRLHEAQQPTAGGDLAGSTLQVNGNQLIVDPADGFLGNLVVSVTVSDGVETDTLTFTVSVTNTAPEVQIADQTLSHTQDSVTLSLPAADVDGDALTYSAEFVANDAVADLAYQLDQQYGLFDYTDGHYWYDYFGHQEKWLEGSGGLYYYLTPDGGLYRWAGSFGASPLLETLDSSYHADPTRLHEAQQPTAGSDLAGSTLQVNGNQLIVDPADGFLGNLVVSVTVSDGVETDTATFNVSVTNTAPQVQIADQTLSHTQDSVTLSLPAADVDADALTYSAEFVANDAVADLAYQLDQQYGLFDYTDGHYWYDYFGHQEKWLEGSGGVYYYLTPDGGLYRWAGSFGASPLLGTLDSSYHADPARLHDAQQPTAGSDLAGSTLQVNGNQLTVDPADGFLGNLVVSVTVSDGIETDTATFNLSVTNTPPQVQIADQSLADADDTLNLTLPAADADGDALTYSAEFVANDAVADLAYQLDQQYGLFDYTGGHYWYDYFGQQEKWLEGSGRVYYVLMPDGGLYRWAGSFESSPLLGTLDGSYHADPTKLHEAQQPTGGSDLAGSTLQVNGNQLVVDPADGFLGDLVVSVTVTDGIDSANTTFTVTVGTGASANVHTMIESEPASAESSPSQTERAGMSARAIGGSRGAFERLTMAPIFAWNDVVAAAPEPFRQPGEPNDVTHPQSADRHVAQVRRAHAPATAPVAVHPADAAALSHFGGTSESNSESGSEALDRVFADLVGEPGESEGTVLELLEALEDVFGVEFENTLAGLDPQRG